MENQLVEKNITIDKNVHKEECKIEQNEKSVLSKTINACTSPIMPISVRKRFLYEQTKGIHPVLQIQKTIV